MLELEGNTYLVCFVLPDLEGKLHFWGSTRIFLWVTDLGVEERNKGTEEPRRERHLAELNPLSPRKDPAVRQSAVKATGRASAAPADFPHASALEEAHFRDKAMLAWPSVAIKGALSKDLVFLALSSRIGCCGRKVAA